MLRLDAQSAGISQGLRKREDVLRCNGVCENECNESVDVAVNEEALGNDAGMGVRVQVRAARLVDA